MIVDLFAGPGGWDEGLRLIGRTDVLGVEWDESACLTAEAAGHKRLRADVAALDPRDYLGAEGLIASPPCQAWSLAGKRGGEEDRAACHELADRMAAGDDSTDWRDWADDRSPLVCQPVRWARELRPEWIALEEVPAVLSLWEHMARIFRAWGYSVWVGTLLAADYGVPQTRTRAILMASRVRTATPPEPTHAEHPEGTDLFGGGHRQKWVSMAEALGWAYTDRPAPTVCAGHNGKQTGAEWGGASVREAMKAAIGTPSWADKRPATTVVGTFCPDIIAAPGHRTTVSRQNAPGSVRVTVQEAGVLQSFPADYPWDGTRTKQYEAVGNAVPPRVAAHVLAAVMGGPHDYIARINSYYEEARKHVA